MVHIVFTCLTHWIPRMITLRGCCLKYKTNRNYRAKNIRRVLVWHAGRLVNREVYVKFGLRTSMSRRVHVVYSSDGWCELTIVTSSPQSDSTENLFSRLILILTFMTEFRKLPTACKDGYSQCPTCSKRCDIIVIDRVGTVAVHLNWVALYIYRCMQSLWVCSSIAINIKLLVLYVWVNIYEMTPDPLKPSHVIWRDTGLAQHWFW